MGECAELEVMQPGGILSLAALGGSGNLNIGGEVSQFPPSIHPNFHDPK